MQIRVIAKSLAVIALTASLGGYVAAQEVSEDIVNATVGKWLTALEDGSIGCHVNLEKGKTIGGRVVTEGSPCGPPWHDELAAWEFSDGGIVFRDATRKELITFQVQEGGPWKTPLDTSPVIYLVPEPGGMDRVPTIKDSAGSWVLTDKSGKALCQIDLLDEPSPRLEEAKAIRLSKDCSAQVNKTKIDAWQIAEIQLVLVGGEDWVYTMTPDKDGFVSDDGKYRLKQATK
jgi:hypothetical protein